MWRHDTGMAPRTGRRVVPKTQTRRAGKKREEAATGYWDVTHQPLQCLVFLLPMIFAFEVGMALVYQDIPLDQRPGLAAQQLLQWFFSLFGVKGLYLPGIALVAVLLAWQLASTHPWKIQWHAMWGMAGESILLAIPVLLLNELIHQAEPLQAVVPAAAVGAFDNLLLSIGAGIYEELVFRLMLIALINFVLIDVLRVKQAPGVALAVIASSLLFAAHHYPPIGADQWATGEFAFRAAAGAYLAAVFVLRGFGLAVGCHVVYDVIAFAMP